MAWLADLIKAGKLKFQKNRKLQCGLALICLLVLFKVAEIGMNYWVRQALRESLIREAEAATRVALDIEWLSLADLWNGRLRGLKLSGYHCRTGGVKLQKLQIVSDGLTLNLNLLLHDQQVQLKSLARTVITAQIDQAAATEYLNQEYGEFKPKIGFEPKRLKVSGEAEVLGEAVALQLQGGLQVEYPRTLRFYPDNLQIANREVPSHFLKFIGEQVPLEIEILKEWPVQVQTLDLEEGCLILTIRELKI